MSVKRVYLDVCALCRPFDDQQQVRIQLETQAVELILTSVREARLEWIISPTHSLEINAIRQTEERQHLLLLIDEMGTKSTYDLPAARQRAEALSAAGMGVADAAHVTFAEAAQADFVTVDDRLLKQCKRMQVSVWCGSPMAYCDKEKLP